MRMLYRRTTLATALLAAVACRPQPAPWLASDAASGCDSRAPYVVLNGPDTVGVSWTTITDSTFESSVHAVSPRALLRFSGRRSPSGAVERLEIRTWHDIADTAGAPTQLASVAFGQGDAVAVVSAPGRGSQVQRDSVPPGSMPYMANVPLFLELMQRRMVPSPGDTVEIPVLWLFTGGEIDRVRMSRPTADSTVLRFELEEFRLRRSRDGAIAGALARPLADSTANQTRIVRPGCE